MEKAEKGRDGGEEKEREKGQPSEAREGEGWRDPTFWSVYYEARTSPEGRRETVQRSDIPAG